jgi:uncharacterized membrane protein YphA (DoxX/SURF4 family)
VFRRINSGLGSLGEKSTDFSWLVLRFLSCTLLISHGYFDLFGDNALAMTGRGMTSLRIGDLLNFPMPLDINALYVFAAIQFGAGIFVLIGLWTDIMSLLILLAMMLSYLTQHLAWFPTLSGEELVALNAAIFLLFFAFGPGTLSLDGFLEERRLDKIRDRMEKNS